MFITDDRRRTAGSGYLFFPIFHEILIRFNTIRYGCIHKLNTMIPFPNSLQLSFQASLYLSHKIFKYVTPFTSHQSPFTITITTTTIHRSG
ncbi:hypothetical protein HOY80DRAFT_956764 [Tuber brumale]|nr:hypothetical protein HOY80DRAFT_956764 [Tuber brumale]